MSHTPTSSATRPPYWQLKARALLYRNLARFGESFEDLWYSRRSHSHERIVTVSKPFTPGDFPLYFYHPKSFKPHSEYPAVVNFHGGGFTMGDARDDIRWANRVADELDVIVISVGYRKAPEFPYPVAVQDGVVALNYLAEHATELNLDVSKVITSGFSAGGNLSLTVPLLYSVLQKESVTPMLDPAHRAAIPTDFFAQIAPRATCTIMAIAAFYPAVDYSLSRDERRATNPEPSKNLSVALYSLFDHSYLPIRADDDPTAPVLRDPFLSPAQASSGFLEGHMPDNVVILTCEYDMLQREGEAFIGKLAAAGRKAKHVKISKVAHGWDKMPGLIVWGEAWKWANQQTDWAYSEACAALKSFLA